VAVSGVWRTAQRTIKNSATIGIFKKAISQMKVHMSTRSIVYPPASGHNPQGPLNCVIARSCESLASISA